MKFCQYQSEIREKICTSLCHCLLFISNYLWRTNCISPTGISKQRKYFTFLVFISRILFPWHQNSRLKATPLLESPASPLLIPFDSCASSLLLLPSSFNLHALSPSLVPSPCEYISKCITLYSLSQKDKWIR